MSKYADTRIVTFKEDYTIPTKGGGKRVIYKKNSVHAIHKSIVKKLEEKKAQIKVEELDYKKVIEQKKKELSNQRKKAVELAYSA